MRFVVTVECPPDAVPAVRSTLTRLGVEIIDVEREEQLLFLAWAPSGDGWLCIAAGQSKASVRRSVRDVEGVVILPAGVRPGRVEELVSAAG